MISDGNETISRAACRPNSPCFALGSALLNGIRQRSPIAEAINDITQVFWEFDVQLFGNKNQIFPFERNVACSLLVAGQENMLDDLTIAVRLFQGVWSRPAQNYHIATDNMRGIR